MALKIQTIKEIRIYLASELAASLYEPELTSIINIVVREVFGISNLHAFMMNEYPVSGEHQERIINICKELKEGKPIQYVIGETSFYDCRIRLKGIELIPRPETEELVDLIIKENQDFKGAIADIGTGSGCIAIALAANLMGAQVTGIDLSEEALDSARENAILNNVNVAFLHGDILSDDFTLPGPAGIIVSNPPYVRHSEKALMSRNVLDFEPHTALFVPDADPLLFYRAILGKSEKALVPGGIIYFEINEALGIEMRELLEASCYSDINLIKDLNSKDRIIKGRKNV
jgi:release factor glutamine methyltransferase